VAETSAVSVEPYPSLTSNLHRMLERVLAVGNVGRYLETVGAMA
jgi:hypothetical protein